MSALIRTIVMNEGTDRPGRPERPTQPRKVPQAPQPIRPTRGGNLGRRIGWILGGIVVALIIIPSLLSDLITDWMWFESQNLASVYTTRLWLALGVFLGSG